MTFHRIKSFIRLFNFMKSHKSESAVSSNVQFYEVGVGQTHYYNLLMLHFIELKPLYNYSIV